MPHTENCCRELAHIAITMTCKNCGSLGADCQLCSSCANTLGECGHCRQKN